MTAKPIYAAIEMGGTKCIVSVGDNPQTARRHRIETRSPDETIHSIELILREEIGPSELEAIGIAGFGPLDVDAQSAHYGRIGRTPKLGWEGTNLVSRLRETFACRVIAETDVNSAAIAEAVWRLDVPFQHLAYVTVGTGIGVGIVQNGQIANGLSHPEIGHIRVEKHLSDRAFAGTCPFHGDCLEGLASGVAIDARWKTALSELPEDHIGVALEAFYLGQLSANLILHYRPQAIIFGGGVSKTPTLISKIREESRAHLGSYLPELESATAMKSLVTAARLGDDAGILGAFMLALDAHSRTSTS